MAAEPVETLVWLEPEQGRFVAQVCERAGLRVVGAGMPQSAMRGGGPAMADAVAALGVSEVITDFRHALATTAARAVLFATAGGGLLDDPALLGTLRERGINAISLEPAPVSLLDLRAAAEFWKSEPVRLVPLLRKSQVFAGASEVLAAIGQVRTVFVSFRASRGQGSLAARLFDAMSVIHAVLGEPDSIDAAAVPSGAVGGLHPAVPESLRGLQGDISANLRFSGAKAASLAITDRAGRWFRGITLLGDAGCIRLTDSGFELSGPDGAVLDALPEAATKGKGAKKSPGARGAAGAAVEVDPNIEAAEVTADQVRRALDARSPVMMGTPPEDWSAVLAMCEAALLSARTGQNESPATMLRMAGVV